MKSKSYSSVALCFMAFLAAGCAGGHAVRCPQISRDVSAADWRAQTAIDTPVSVAFDHAPFGEALEKIGNIAGVAVDVRWPKLEEMGVEAAAPVTLKLDNVPASVALKRAFELVSIDDSNPVDWRVRDGGIRVSSRRDLDQLAVLETYDVRDLLLGWQYKHLAKGDCPPTTRAGAGADSGIICAWGAETPSETKAAFIKQQLDELEKLIIDSVGRPEDWHVNGGTVSSSQAFNGLLIIRTTPENHREVAKLLCMLRHPKG